MTLHKRSIQVIKKAAALAALEAVLCLFPAGMPLGYAFPDKAVRECLAPHLTLNHQAFLDALEQAYNQGRQLKGREPSRGLVEKEIDLISAKNQLDRIKVLTRDVLQLYQETFPQEKEKFLLLQKYIAVADKIYGEQKFSSGEFTFNHDLQVARNVIEYGGSLEEVLIALAHNMDQSQFNELKAGLRESLRSEIRLSGNGKKIKNRLQKILANAGSEDWDRLYKLYRSILDQRYQVHSKGVNSAENYMNAIIKMTKGDPRLMRIFLADKRASINTQSERGDDQFVREIDHVVAPLAGRLGLKELEAEFFNETFRLKEPKEYQWVEDKVRKTYGMSYEQLADYLQGIAEKLKKVAAQSGIEVQVKSRLKSHFGIYSKEVRLSEVRGKKKTLHLEDLMGIRIICKNQKDLYKVIAETENALLKKKLGQWRPAPKGYDHKKGAHGNLINMVYLDILNKTLGEDGGLIEIQFITEALHRERETAAPHWSYAVKKRTGGKQRFDHTEPLIIFSEDREFDPWDEFDNYFRYIYNSPDIQDWVFVFQKTEEKGRDVIKPKRLQKGANGPVFAAQRGVNEFDRYYSGIDFWEWKGNKLVPLGSKRKPLTSLQDGDIVSVIRGGGMSPATLSQMEYKIKNFLRTNILFLTMNLDQNIENNYIDNARRFLEKEFAAKKVTTPDIPNSLNIKAKYFEEFLRAFAKHKRLLNIRELCLGLGLQIIKADEVVQWAEERGEKELSNKKIDVNDRGIIDRFKDSPGGFEAICIEVGLGRKTPEAVEHKLKERTSVSVSTNIEVPGDNGARVEYKVNIQKIRGQTGKTAARKLLQILKSQGIDNLTRKDLKIKEDTKNIVITFQNWMKYEQLRPVREQITEAFEAVKETGKTEVPEDKNGDKVRIGVEISLAKLNMLSGLMQRFPNLGDDALVECFVDEANNKVHCVIQVDRHDARGAIARAFRGIADGSNIKFVPAKQVMQIKQGESVPGLSPREVVRRSI